MKEKRNHLLMFVKNYPVKKWNSQCDDHAPKAPRAVRVQYVECIVHYEPFREQEIKFECMMMKNDYCDSLTNVFYLEIK